jgi:hypothetical protein
MPSIPDADLDAIEAQAKRNLNMASALSHPEVVFLSGVILRLTTEVRAARETIEAVKRDGHTNPDEGCPTCQAVAEYDARRG